MTIQIIKDFADISWQVTEPEYRADRAVSYSTLATFARDGIKGLCRVIKGEKLSTASLRHGSLVDTMLTDSENFDNLYLVAKYKAPSENVKQILDLIWERSEKEVVNLDKLSTDLLTECINQIGYGGDNWRAETKIKKIKEEGAGYFKMIPLVENSDRTLVSQEEYDMAEKCVSTLKEHPYTKWLFDGSNPNIKVYYQLKFKMSFDGNINNVQKPLAWKDQFLEEDTIRCMFDIIVVNYERKLICPIDLKTTFHAEEDFELSIQDWHYDLQATMYSYILRNICSQDDYFRDFMVVPFRFLPINKFHLNPQFYVYSSSTVNTQEVFIDYNNKVHAPWYDYLSKVRWHIANQEFNYNKSTVEKRGINIVNFFNQ